MRHQTTPGAEDIEAVEIQLFDMRSTAMKVSTAKWLVEMWEYIVENPQRVVYGFKHAGILSALDGCSQSDSQAGEEEADSLSDEDTIVMMKMTMFSMTSFPSSQAVLLFITLAYSCFFTSINIIVLNIVLACLSL